MCSHADGILTYDRLKREFCQARFNLCGIAIVIHLIILNIRGSATPNKIHLLVIHRIIRQIGDRVDKAHLDTRALHIAALGNSFHSKRGPTCLNLGSIGSFIDSSNQLVIAIHFVLVRAIKGFPSQSGIVTFQCIIQVFNRANNTQGNMFLLFTTLEDRFHSDVMLAFGNGESVGQLVGSGKLFAIHIDLIFNPSCRVFGSFPSEGEQ